MIRLTTLQMKYWIFATRDDYPYSRIDGAYRHLGNRILFLGYVTQPNLFRISRVDQQCPLTLIGTS